MCGRSKGFPFATVRFSCSRGARNRSRSLAHTGMRRRSSLRLPADSGRTGARFAVCGGGRSAARLRGTRFPCAWSGGACSSRYGREMALLHGLLQARGLLLERLQMCSRLRSVEMLRRSVMNCGGRGGASAGRLHAAGIREWQREIACTLPASRRWRFR